MIRRPPASRRGLTLLEVLLALGLITLVSAMMFAFYDVSLQTRDRGRRAITESHLARIMTQRIAEEIRSANGFLMGTPGIKGTGRMITLQIVSLPDKDVFLRRSIKQEPPPPQSDIRQVQYYLAYDDEQSHNYPDGTQGPLPLGLVRREVKTPFQGTRVGIQKETADVDLLSPELKYLRFRYYDGVEWADKWNLAATGLGGVGNSLPLAVEVTVGYDELPPEDTGDIDIGQSDFEPSPPEPYSRKTYTCVIPLQQADRFFGARMMRAQQLSESQAAEAGATQQPGGGT